MEKFSIDSIFRRKLPQNWIVASEKNLIDETRQTSQKMLSKRFITLGRNDKLKNVETKKNRAMNYTRERQQE